MALARPGDTGGYRQQPVGPNGGAAHKRPWFSRLILWPTELRARWQAQLRSTTRLAVRLVCVSAFLAVRALSELAFAARRASRPLHHIDVPGALGLAPAAALGGIAVLWGSSMDDAVVSLVAVVLPYSAIYLLSRRFGGGPTVTLSLVGLLIITGLALFSAPAQSTRSADLLAIAWLAPSYAFLGALVASIIPRRERRARSPRRRSGRARRLPPLELL